MAAANGAATAHGRLHPPWPNAAPCPRQGRRHGIDCPQRGHTKPALERGPARHPYRANTKGKVERFNGYLKGSFLVPLAASLQAAGLKLTCEVANAHVRRWIDEVANARIHATTKAVPASRLAEQRAVMSPGPALKGGRSANPRRHARREPAALAGRVRRAAGGRT